MGIFSWFSKKTSENQNEHEIVNETDEELGRMMEEEFAEPGVRDKLLYHFAHTTLRDACFLNHPELVDQLQSIGSEPVNYPFLHFWSAAEHLIDVDELSEIEDDDNWPPFDKMKLDVQTTGDYQLYLVTMPKPRMSPHAYYIAIVKSSDDPMEYNKNDGLTRYFTLEYTEYNSLPVFCEWDDGDEHINYGECDVSSVEDFTLLIKKLLINGVGLK